MVSGCSYYNENMEPVRRAVMACDSEDAVCIANAKDLVNDQNVQGSYTNMGSPP